MLLILLVILYLFDFKGILKKKGIGTPSDAGIIHTGSKTLASALALATRHKAKQQTRSQQSISFRLGNGRYCAVGDGDVIQS